MGINYTSVYNTKQTPQSEPIPGKNQVKNNAGGYTFEVSLLNRLKRFLVLGTEGGTYYATERALTIENAKAVIEIIQKLGVEAVNTIVEVSVKGEAPKNDAAIFALALAVTYGDVAVKAAATQAINKVCRTGTHLFTFCENINQLGKWPRSVRNGVSKFYTEPSLEKVAMQIVKYRQRNGWTHKDVLRLAHPRAKSPELNNLFRYAVGKETSESKLHPLVEAFEEVQKLGDNKADIKKAISLIEAHKLPWEALPTAMLNNKAIWEALLPNMPMNALVRNLAKMTNLGLLESNLNDSVKLVCSKLDDAEFIRKSRLHPVAVINALKVYQQGHGDKGSLSWTPVPRIIEALDEAFYKAFDNVESTGLNYLLALDVSGSMGGGGCAGVKLTPREASAVMAMVTLRAEPNVEIVAFSHNLITLDLTRKMRLDAVIKKISNLNFGSTDCALPMIHAQKKKLNVDMFCVYTDNETWYGGVHPSQALVNYRKAQEQPEAKLAVVACTPTNFSIADPSDKGQMDFVGFSTSTPQVMNLFATGRI